MMILKFKAFVVISLTFICLDVAFQAARAADSKAKLFYNDYSAEACGQGILTGPLMLSPSLLLYIKHQKNLQLNPMLFMRW